MQSLCNLGLTCVLNYAKNTQRTALPHIQTLKVEKNSNYVVVDAITQRNLEILHNFIGGQKNTLADIYDHTVTAMGSRLFKRWLVRPLRDRIALQLHRILSAGFGGQVAFSIINASKRGSRSDELSKRYRDHLYLFKPDLVVVSLSNNDSPVGFDERK